MAQSVTLLACVLAVLLNTSTAIPSKHCNCDLAQEEAEQIALETSQKLLPEPDLVANISAALSTIRSQHPALAKIQNRGRWKLGEVNIRNLNPKSTRDLKNCEFGPVKEIKEGHCQGVTRVIFKKHYNPYLLAVELKAKFGVAANGVWKENIVDFGSIAYKPSDETFTFRQGLANCGANCKEHHFWVFRVDRESVAKLCHEFKAAI